MQYRVTILRAYSVVVSAASKEVAATKAKTLTAPVGRVREMGTFPQILDAVAVHTDTGDLVEVTPEAIVFGDAGKITTLHG